MRRGGPGRRSPVVFGAAPPPRRPGLEEEGAADQRRDNVLSVRITADALLAVDLLVHAGVARSRSEAAALLIEAGVRSNRALFERIEGLKEELADLRSLASQLAVPRSGAGSAPGDAGRASGATVTPASGVEGEPVHPPRGPESSPQAR